MLHPGIIIRILHQHGVKFELEKSDITHVKALECYNPKTGEETYTDVTYFSRSDLKTFLGY